MVTSKITLDSNEVSSMEPVPDILNFRYELIDFLRSIDLAYPPTNRFEESFKEIELALRDKEGTQRLLTHGAHIRHALAELSELKFIVKSVKKMNVPNQVLKNKFKLILSGERPIEKKSNSLNDDSRNVVFELALATYIQERGVQVHYEEGNDIYFEINNCKVAIECKRINGDPRKSLKNLLRKAHKQLLNRQIHIDFGVIAVNIDTVFFNEGKLLISVDGKGASQGCYSMIKEFIGKNGDLWQRRNIINSPDFVPAIFICLGGTAYAMGTNETANAFFVLVNNTSNPVSKNFQKVEEFSSKLKGEYTL